MPLYVPVSKNRGYEHPGYYRRYNLTFELSDAVNDGQFPQSRQNLQRYIENFNNDMVVKMKLVAISSKNVITFADCDIEIDDSNNPEVTEEEVFAVFPPPPPTSCLKRARKFLGRLCFRVG